MTKGEFVYSVMGSLDLDTKDTVISRRLVLNIANSIATTYMAQRIDSLKKDKSLVKKIPCVEMIPVDRIECGNVTIQNCNNIVRTKEKIPTTIKGSDGSAIFVVTNIDDSIRYTKTDRYKYFNSKKNKFSKKNKKVFFEEEGYVYIPEEEIELVNIYQVVVDEEKAEEISICSECKNTKDSAKCKSLWDEDFVCSDKLIEKVRELTIQQLSTKVQIPDDENPNLDSNEKTATVKDI